MTAASVIVPVGDDALRLEWVLAGLSAQTVREFEVIVCSDAGTVATRRVVECYREQLSIKWRYLPGPKVAARSGAARNYAAQVASGDLLIFLDGDMVPDPDFIEAHVSHYAPDMAVFGYRRRFPMHLVRPFDGRLDYAELHLYSAPDPRLFGYARWAEPRLHLHFLSCNYSIPAERFCALGGHDERCIGWGGEDIDLGFRLERSGCRLVPLWGIGVCTHLDHPHRGSGEVSQSWVCDPDEPLCRNGGPLPRLTASAAASGGSQR